MKKFNFYLALSLFATAPSFAAIDFNDQKVLLAMGQALYEQKGSSSCLFCHGVAGVNGKVKTAAALSDPTKWKSYKAIKNISGKDDERLKEAVIHLILNGSIGHRKNSFAKDWFDWSIAGNFDGQMQGLRGASSSSWLKKQKSKGVTKEIAAKAVFEYIKTLQK